MIQNAFYIFINSPRIFYFFLGYGLNINSYLTIKSLFHQLLIYIYRCKSLRLNLVTKKKFKRLCNTCSVHL